MLKNGLKSEFNRNSKDQLSPPFSIRLNWQQREELEKLTKGGSWGTYIKEAIFSDMKKPPANSRVIKEMDHKILGKLLGALGKSRISNNINQLARAANSGSLQVNEETVKALHDACRAIQWMKITLIEGMGLKAHAANEPEDRPDDPER